MIVQCENCQTKFNVDSDRIKDEGSRVKCSQCSHIFMIFREAGETPPPPQPPASEEPAAQPDDSDVLQAGIYSDMAAMEQDLEFSEQDEFFEEGSEPGLDEEPELDEFVPEIEESKAEEFAPVEDEAPADLEDDFTFEETEDELLEPDLNEASEEMEAEIDEGALDDFEFEESEQLDLLGQAEAEMPAGESEDQELAETMMDLEDVEAGFIEEEEPELAETADDLEEVEPDLDEDLGPSLDEEPELAETVVEDRFEEEPEEDDFAVLEEDIAIMEEAGEPVPEEMEAELKPRRKRRGLLFWFLLFILVLAAAGAGVWYFAPELLAPYIPALGEESPKAAEDAIGNKLIALDDKLTKDFFKENEIEGQLLVITGLANNNYQTPRSHIRLNAVIHDAEDKVLARTTVYCGNVLTDENLEQLSLEAIDERLKQQSGDNNANVNVMPGQGVEFMIVFKIPENLARYTIEVASSQPAKPGQ